MLKLKNIARRYLHDPFSGESSRLQLITTVIAMKEADYHKFMEYLSHYIYNEGGDGEG